ncbi:unnamed protein product [Somion occarium]|uniref:Integrase core domain-containing protein n=1 Tax=Somion occarium TaxID=3059160 RepID=A0ABP1CTF8_9APHY
MEEKRGPNRGSYIWGRSVHNIRIERLWLDFTQGIGAKWKTFFQKLETCDGLDPDIPAHIWLLHHLFLDELNDEIHQWAETWNNHKIFTPGLGNKSPQQLKFWSILKDGGRGLPVPVQEPISEEEIPEYGIDWNDYANPALQAHHNNANASDVLGNNPFVIYQPETLHNVEVNEPNCPLSAAQVVQLDNYIMTLDDDTTMAARKKVWILALAFCINLMREN